MILDTEALVMAANAVARVNPVRAARALRTLAGAVDAARPAISMAPAPWGWTASIAASIVVGGLRAYAAELDPEGKPASVHGWYYDTPALPGRYLVTRRTGTGAVTHVMVAQWDPGTDFAGWSVTGVYAWQDVPPPAESQPEI